MKYHIICNGKRIASFIHESDRDICLDCLREFYEDTNFQSENSK